MSYLILNRILLIVCLFVVGPLTQAAPVPGASGKALAEKLRGLYESPLGFSLNAQSTNWIQVEKPKSSRYIAAMYQAPQVQNGVQASLTVRIDDLRKKNYNLKSYVGRWLQEYPKFGFEVLGDRDFELKGRKGWVIDLLNKESQRQIRQVVFVASQRAVILTCRDHRKTFMSSLKSCNEIIKSFKW